MPRATFEQTYRGKLLLTGEYFVLDGVPALAVPTKLGQRFAVNPTKGAGLAWRSFDPRGKEWFSTHLNWDGSVGYQRQANAFSKRLYQLLRAADELNPGALVYATANNSVVSHLEFERLWGLGTSSTLISFVADWLEVDAFALLENTFGGSGYDLACATAKGPIVYTRDGTTPTIAALDWYPAWLDQTYFVYRNQKQNSREGIRSYRSVAIPEKTKEEVASLTAALTEPTLHLRSAQKILQNHERIVAATLSTQTVQEELFPDFPGQLKSLGAWGGDFIWALCELSKEKVEEYFNVRGYNTVITYREMIL
ncbi:GYDIA family GHMP kinase [Neolewinella antarctica]|uniref:Mevalonate kinase n=1 Tax=Neolewinella antarctica TaxID=442734 RepID=A0ABX0XHT0_9BACT|nr:GYDIA family GHMP kinase [Neolewinella antarctica]NJC28416.1 mevalonate kinase [Neolewinella antarctica]